MFRLHRSAMSMVSNVPNVHAIVTDVSGVRVRNAASAISRARREV